MCTSAIYQTKNTYFGRNLDLDYSYHETITITPHNFPLHFQTLPPLDNHYAIIGVAYVVPDHNGNDYPLYYDAINDQGLGIAGLRFAGNATYFDLAANKDNVTPYEFIPYILGTCASVAEARTRLANLNFYNHNFSAELPLSELHWLIADTKESIVVESTADGLHVYDNPIGVLTNNPTFPDQLLNLSNYQSVSPTDPQNTIAPTASLVQYSRGLGTKFLPGGMDSESRFVKATFTKQHATSPDDELSSISQFFHILHSVDQSRGSDQTKPHSEAPVGSPAEFEITVYSSGYNLDQGIAYYTCYDNHQISAVDMHKTNLETTELTSFPMINTEQINYQN